MGGDPDTPSLIFLFIPLILRFFTKIRPFIPIFFKGLPMVFQDTIPAQMGKYRFQMKTSSCLGGLFKAIISII